MMVNLGWIPIDKLKEFDKSINEQESFEISEEEFNGQNVIYDRFSGFAFPNEDYDPDEDGHSVNIV